MTQSRQHLSNQLNLIKSLTPSQLDLLTEETMFKVVEEICGGICWNASTKINEQSSLITPRAFLKWSQHPELTLSKVIDLKVTGSDSITKEHFGGVRSGSKFIFEYHYRQYQLDQSYDLEKHFMFDIEMLSKVIVSTRGENEEFATIRKRTPFDYKNIGIDKLIKLKKTDRVKFTDAEIVEVDSNLTPFFPVVLLS